MSAGKEAPWLSGRLGPSRRQEKAGRVVPAGVGGGGVIILLKVKFFPNHLP